MAFNMDAILRIRAQTTGSETVTGLSNALTSAATAGQKLAGTTGLLKNAFGALAPVLSVAGLTALVSKQIEAGDRMYDLSQRTGVAVESLAKFEKAARLGGTSLDSVAGALGKLSKAMVASVSGTEVSGRVKADMDRAVDAVRDGERRQVAEIRDGERRQTSAVQDEARQRIDAIERESDKTLQEIGKRYRKMEQMLNDRLDDQSDQQERAAENELNTEVKRISRFFDERRKAIQDDKALSDEERDNRLQDLEDSRDAELDAVRQSYADRARERQRAARDEQQRLTDELEEKRQKEENAAKQTAENQKRILQERADAETETIRAASAAQLEQIKKLSEETIKALKGDPVADGLSQQMEELGLSGKGASKAFNELGINVKNADGTMRSADDVMLDIATRFKGMEDGPKKVALAMQLFGRSGAELIPMLNQGGDAIDRMKVKMNQAFAEKADEYNDKLITLGGKVGGLARGITVALLPALDALTSILTAGVDLFAKLPEPLQAIIGAFAILATGATALAVPLALIAPALTSIGTAFAGLGIGATIAGWAGAIGPFVGTFTAAMGGLLAWMTGTFLPTLVAIFSGPAGWIALGVAALVAGVVFFREPIMKFFGWALGEVGKFWENVFKFIYDTQIKPWVDLWNNVLKKPITEFFGWLWKSTEPIRNFFVNLGTIATEGTKFLLRIVNDLLVKPLLSLGEWAFKGLIELGYKVFVEPFVYLWEVVKKPLADFWDWLGGTARVAFDALIQIGYGLFIEPWVQLWDAIKKPLSDLWTWLGETSDKAFKALVQIGYDLFIKPWVQLWDTIKKPISDLYGWIQSGIEKTFKEINRIGNEKFIEPWGKLWDLITSKPEDFKKKVEGWFDNLYTTLLDNWRRIPGILQSAWDSVLNGMGRTWRWMVNGATDALNNLIDLWNNVAKPANNAAKFANINFRLPEFQQITPAGIPGFARGTYIDRPTLGLIGEGRNPREYVIPEGGMDAAADGWQRGLRGNALVAAWQSPGLAPGRASMGPPGGGMGGQVAIPEVRVQISQTGNTLQMPDGSQWVSRDEAVAMVAQGVQLTLGAVDRLNRSAAGRSAGRA